MAEGEPQAAPQMRPDASPNKLSLHAELTRQGAFDPSLLSEKFFEEGDLHEATNFKNLPHEPERRRRSTAHLEFDSFDRIPTRRKPMLLALAMLVFSLAGVAWWASANSPTEAWRRSAESQPTPNPAASTPDRVASALAPLAAAPEPVAADSTSPAPAPSEAIAPSEATAPSEAIAPSEATAPSEAIVPSEATASPSADSTATVTTVPAAVAPPAPPAQQPVESSLVTVEPPGTEAVTATDPAPLSTVKSTEKRKVPRAPKAKPDVGQRQAGPLMLWSPEKQMMVPAEDVTGSSAVR